MDLPLVSIVIPVFNRRYFLLNTLNSVRRQTYSNWECILINDGSTDGSLEILEAFQEIDRRFKVISTTNNGVSRARNLGICHSRGVYISFLDSDDLWSPSKLQAQVKFLETNLEKQGVISGFYVSRINAHGVLKQKRKIILPSSFDGISWLNFKGNGPLLTSTMLISKQALTLMAAEKWFDEQLSTTADVDFYFRLKQVVSIGVLKESLAIYVEHSSQMHLDHLLLQRDYPEMLKKFDRLGIQYKRDVVMGGLNAMSCLLALRQFEFKLAFRYLVDSLKFSQSTWLVLFVFVFYKRTKGRIFDRRLNWCRGIYEGAI